MYLFLSVIYFHYLYKKIHCKSTHKSSVCNKWHHTYHNSYENLNQFIDKSPSIFYSAMHCKIKSIDCRMTIEFIVVDIISNLMSRFSVSMLMIKKNKKIRENQLKIFCKLLNIEIITFTMSSLTDEVEETSMKLIYFLCSFCG